MAIPIASGQTLDVQDSSSGMTYRLAYVTEDREDAFLKLQNKMNASAKAFMEPAGKLIDKENPGKKWGKGEREKAVIAKARELADDATEGDTKEGLQISRAMIDFFVIGWSGGPQGTPEFPKDGHPGRLFPFGGASELANMISEHMSELVGMTAAEAKN